MTEELPFDPRPTKVEAVGPALASAIADIQSQGGKVTGMEVDRHHPAHYTLHVFWPDEPMKSGTQPPPSQDNPLIAARHKPIVPL